MAIVSGLEVIGISVHYRVYIKYFLTKTKLSTCSDMLPFDVTSCYFVPRPYK